MLRLLGAGTWETCFDGHAPRCARSNVKMRLRRCDSLRVLCVFLIRVQILLRTPVPAQLGLCWGRLFPPRLGTLLRTPVPAQLGLLLRVAVAWVRSKPSPPRDWPEPWSSLVSAGGRSQGRAEAFAPAGKPDLKSIWVIGPKIVGHVESPSDFVPRVDSRHPRRGL